MATIVSESPLTVSERARHRETRWEIEEFNRVVTDYEIARGLERA